MQGLEHWEASQTPFTVSLASDDLQSICVSSSLLDVFRDLRSKKRGLIVVGEQLDVSESQACLQIAAELGWPLCADALSGNYKSHHIVILTHTESFLLQTKFAWQALHHSAQLDLQGCAVVFQACVVSCLSRWTVHSMNESLSPTDTYSNVTMQVDYRHFSSSGQTNMETLHCSQCY